MKKRFTQTKYGCPTCDGQFSRKWVLQRHMKGQHPEYDAPSKRPVWDNGQRTSWKQFQTYQELQERRHDERTTRMHEINMKMFETWSDIQNKKQYFNPGLSIGPLNDLLKNISDFMQAIFRVNFLLPKSMVSGFSCYVCSICIQAELPIPIKDIGHDLTAYAKHRCNSNAPKLENPDERHSLLSKLFTFNLDVLKILVNALFPGEKHLFAERMRLKIQDGQNISDEMFGIPSKFPLGTMDYRDKPSWIARVVESGNITLTEEEVDNFLTRSRGTFAIFKIPSNGQTDYYLVFLGRRPSAASAFDTSLLLEDQQFLNNMRGKVDSN